MDEADFLILEKGNNKSHTNFVPSLDIECDDLKDILPKNLLREEIQIPDVPEVEIVRHYVKLSRTNYGVDSGIYPLGSCTMKYNPKINEHIARYAEFSSIHPLQDDNEGALQLIHHLSILLGEITGMDGFTIFRNSRNP
jgi:glycine dehydrogenase subunit 2